ncbi:unnamed protein product [Rhizophagus irregularis]|nr:unnamed protein product [Rhizophagus irregularis]
MSCSKIFSGELPELTYDILKYFKNDFSTLHSCILVNRLWCRLAIPLLWEDPFSNPTKNYNFIEIYLNNLNGDLITELNEYRIEDNLFPLYTLFNYPSLIKYLNTWKILSPISEWVKNAIKTLKPEKRYTYEVDNFKRLIQILLFKLFIDNEANLHTLEIEIFYAWNSHLDNILELILQNPNFIHNIKNLNFYIRGDSNGDQIIYLLFDLIENMKQSLNYLTISTASCENYIECSSIVLQNLGQVFPFKLEYLDLSLHIKMNESDDEHCDYEELASMKDEVEEFKLYDIKVLRRYGSWISFYEFSRD